MESNSDKDTKKDTQLGKPGCPVRVLNFAGGGFDTIMQLGVAHALLVIQGRAPDAIVGVSAGAIQAAAVAEILQAEEDVPDGPEQKDRQESQNNQQAGENATASPEKKDPQQSQNYQRRRAARVKRLRETVDFAQRAPEELIDASLPDAYQIDSLHPLQALRTARFPNEERDKREDHLRARSGLVALYNQLLGIHLPVGTVTRIVRRWLGFKAAGEIPKLRSRWPVELLELFRIWLLFGAGLHRLVMVIALLLRPVFLAKTYARVAPAGSLIFRFRALRFLVLGVLYCFGLFVLAGTWVTFSTFPAAFVGWLFSGYADASSHWLLLSLFAYLPVLVLTLLQVARKHDAVTKFGAAWDGLKGLMQFAILLVIWGGLPFMFICTLALDDWRWSPESFIRCVDNAKPFFHLATAIFCVTLLVSWGLSVWDRLRHKGKGEAKIELMQWYGKRFLRSYNLSDSLLHHYGLEKFLSDLFDPEYYEPINRGQDWEDSLKEPDTETDKEKEKEKEKELDLKTSSCEPDNKCAAPAEGKKIGYYRNEKRNPPIVLGLGVADVGSGEVDVMDDDAPLVCGLRAATAWTPVFPAVRYGDKCFIDSTNVSSVPMPVLLRLLRRERVHDKSTVIHVYRVSPVAFSRPPGRQPQQPQTFVNLIDTALRALRLRQYLDADLERRLTERHSVFMREVKKSVGDREKKTTRFRIWVAPIELDLPVGLNARIMFGDRAQRREEILKTIAQGCRAALEVMIADSVKGASRDVPRSMTVPCARAVRHHLTQCVDKGVAKSFVCQPLPGSQAASECSANGAVDTPPGLREICAHCELGDESPAVCGSQREKVLVWREWESTAASWPHEFEPEPEKKNDTPDRHFATAPKLPAPKVVDALGRYWPRERRALDADKGPTNRPLVSLLFSGGVFRGVFQVGVLNALNILGVKPDIVAGASVGSITAGMAAQLLCATDAECKKEHAERNRQLALLAAVYLAVDRVILTDRFADFVREFTIRAAGTRFSIRQADQLFRKYDQPWLLNFDKGARQVIGGIERLFYINPYQLKQLAKAARHRRGQQAGRLGKRLAQQWLDRMNVGEEVLGAEALEQLIEYFILSGDQPQYLKLDSEDAGTLHSMFSRFLGKGVILLATATDLTDGQLLTLGDPFHGAEDPGRVDLTNALLASSAFPGVFRPRWAPEVFPDTNQDHQFIDGGVMDNFPIDAVVNLLRNASSDDPNQEGLVVRRPTNDEHAQTPHLAFAASLEPEVEPITSDDALCALETYWPALRKRAKQLRYNKKLDAFKNAANRISELYRELPKKSKGAPPEQIPLNLEIAALKPRWLCGTFAFHPMLGYRRARQAESIAHGCALTLLKFKEYTNDEKKNSWLDAWGINRAELPVTTTELKLTKTLEVAHERWKDRRPESEPGECWLRQKRCPFSKAALEQKNIELEDYYPSAPKIKDQEPERYRRLEGHTIEALSSIHTCCEKPATHEPGRS